MNQSAYSKTLLEQQKQGLLGYGTSPRWHNRLYKKRAAEQCAGCVSPPAGEAGTELNTIIQPEAGLGQLVLGHLHKHRTMRTWFSIPLDGAERAKVMGKAQNQTLDLDPKRRH